MCVAVCVALRFLNEPYLGRSPLDPKKDSKKATRGVFNRAFLMDSFEKEP